MTVQIGMLRYGDAAARPVVRHRDGHAEVAAATPPALSLLGALALMVAAVGTIPLALAAQMGRDGNADAQKMWWVGICTIVVPLVVRLCSRAPSRAERLLLVVALGLLLFGPRVAFDPVRVPYHDELLHEFTARSIMDTGRLYETNSMLPASPVFPGLELVTTAIANLTGLSVPVAGLLVVALARVLTMAALFLLAEQITGSAYAGGLACAVYAASPQFTLWNSYFAYESLAIPLLVFGIYCLMRVTDGESTKRSLRWSIATVLTVGALVATHHITAFVFLCVVFAWSATTFTSRAFRRDRARTWLIAFASAALAVAWVATAGRTVLEYLRPIAEEAVQQVREMAEGSGPPRKLFADETGEKNPLSERIVSVTSLLLVCGALTIAWWHVFRTRARRLRSTLATCEPDTSAWRYLLATGRRPSAFAALTVLSLAFPLSYAGRFTNATKFIAARSASFVYLGAAVVIAVWLTVRNRHKRGVVLVVTGLLVAYAVIGGVAFGAQPSYMRLPGDYMVSADARSVDTPSLDAAAWADGNLREGGRLSADRVNRMLFANAAAVHPVTSLGDKLYVNWLYYDAELGPFQRSLIRLGRIEYVVSDVRLTTGLPRSGVYFEEGEIDGYHTDPLPLDGVLKFRHIEGVDTLYDNGVILVFDIRRLDEGS